MSLHVTFTGKGEFTYTDDLPTLTDAYEERTGIDDGPVVPENNRHAEHPGHDLYELIESAGDAGLIVKPEGVALDVIPFDEIEGSGTVIRVFPIGQPTLGVTSGWCPMEDLVLPEAEDHPHEKRIVHVIEQVLERANEVLRAASVVAGEQA